MTKALSILAVVAVAGTTGIAGANIVSNGVVANAIDGTATFSATNSTEAISLASNPHIGRTISTSETYLVSGGWINTAGGGTRFLGTGASPNVHTGVFNGVPQQYAGQATQVSTNIFVQDFQGTTTEGNRFAQVSVFSSTGANINLASFGFPTFGFGVGEGLFVGDVRNAIGVELGVGESIEIVGITFGFFNGASFLGSGTLADTNVGPDGLAALFTINTTGVGALATFTESFIFFEYSVVPAPGAFALLGLGGLVATRRRR